MSATTPVKDARPRVNVAARSITSAALANPWLWVAVLTVVGIALRRYHLGSESLWFDETDIVALARRSLPALVGGFAQAGENGPLYTLALHFWLSAVDASPFLARAAHLVFGPNNEAVVRAPAALFGAASIPLMYMLGQRVGGPALGLVAAALLTVNPFHIWYSQDAKMYTLFVLVTLASTVLYIDALRRNTVPLWLGYVLATWITLTVHSFGALVLLAQVVSTPALLPRAPDARGGLRAALKSRSAVRWGWAMLLILLPLFPIAWLRAAALVTNTADVGGWYTATTLPDIVSAIFVNFAVNRAAPATELVGSIALAAMAMLGLLALWLRFPRGGAVAPESGARDRSWLLLVALWSVPVLALWLITLRLPLFQPRYLIISLPAYLVLAAVGLLALRRIHALAFVAGALAVLLPAGFALVQVNYSGQAQKEDWRGAMAYVQDHLRLRDEIVVFPGYMKTAVQYYYRPGGPSLVPQVDIKTIPSLRTQDFGVNQLDAALREAVTCHERAWLITSPPRQAQEDPENRVQQWFQYNYHTFDTRIFNGVTVYGISFNGQPNCWYPEPDHKERHDFENGLTFLGYIYELRSQNSGNTQPDASDVPLTMYWRVGDRLTTDISVRLVIRDPAGKAVVDEILGPLNGFWPASTWTPGLQVIDYRDPRLPGGLTPGDYTVSLQVLPSDNPERPLPLKGGGSEIVFGAPLHVVPWKP